jgi:hypothetical protein
MRSVSHATPQLDNHFVKTYSLAATAKMTASLLVLSGDDIQQLVRTAVKPGEVVRIMARVFELVSGSKIGEGMVSINSPWSCIVTWCSCMWVHVAENGLLF